MVNCTISLKTPSLYSKELQVDLILKKQKPRSI